MQGRLIRLLVPLCWALACGGRFAQSSAGDDDDDSPPGQAGSAPSRSGSSNRGGSSGLSGAHNGGTQAVGGGLGTSGTTAAGGATCNCDPIACSPGFFAVPDANGCCYHCELDLKSCEVQRQSYITFREQLLSRYSYGCMTASDCAIYYDKNYCGATSCGFPIVVSNYMNLVTNLETFAKACTRACPPAPEPPCAPSALECISGMCQ